MSDIVSSIADQIHFERSARRSGARFTRDTDGRFHGPARLRYWIAIDVPVFDDQRVATTEFVTGQREPAVFLDGPVCLRHRYIGGSICMWRRTDPSQLRWTESDGLQSLIGHITEHAYCEACCRDGQPWPKDEAPGRHPRPNDCPSCSSRR